MWAEMISCLRLGRDLRSPAAAIKSLNDTPVAPVMVPPALLQLLPPPPEAGWPAGAPLPRAGAGTGLLAEYPPARRAQRLSFQLAALLPDLVRQVTTCNGV